jgi:hypothetical protein
LVKCLAITALRSINTIFDALIDLIELTIEAFKEVINKRIHIPFISDLYSQHAGGRDLTLLSLVALIVSLPLTTLYKAIEKEAPFKDVVRVTASLSPLDKDLNKHKEKKAWGYAYGLFHIAQGIVGCVADYKAGASSLEPIPKNAEEIFPERNIFAGEDILSYMDLILGLFAQTACNPVGYPKFNMKMPPASDRGNSINAPNYWAHLIWVYQWFTLGINILFTAYAKAGIYRGQITLARSLKLQFLQNVFNTLLGIPHMAFMSTLDVQDKKKRDSLKQHNSDVWARADRNTQAEYNNYLQWANTNCDGLSSGNGITDKGFGNIMDTFPEIGKLFLTKEIALATGGELVAIAFVFDVLGHFGEGIMYLQRTSYNGLL